MASAAGAAPPSATLALTHIVWMLVDSGSLLDCAT